MAGNCIFQLWWWIPLAILSGCFLCPNGNQMSFTHLSYFHSDTDADADVVVFLREDCDREIDVNRIRDFLENSAFDVSVGIMPKSVTCETQSWGLGSLIHVLGRAKTKALIAALDSSTCEVATRLAHLWKKTLLTWTCPLRVLEERELSSVVRLSPSLLSLSYILAEIFLHFGWKSVAVISTDHEPWSSLDGAVVDALRGINVVLRYHLILPRHASVEQIRKILKSVHGIPRRATILCLPLTDESTNRVLIELDVLWRVHSTKSIVLMMHTRDDNLFLPPDLKSEIDADVDDDYDNVAEDAIATPSSLYSTEDAPTTDSSLPPNVSLLNASRFLPEETAENVQDHVKTESEPLQRFIPSSSLSNVVAENLLVVVPLDQRYDVERLYNGTEVYVPPTLLDRLNESLNVLTRDNSSINYHNNKMYTYVLMDWRIDKWKPIIAVTEQEERLTIRRLAKEATVFVEAEGTEFLSCEDTANAYCSGDPTELSFRSTHVIAVGVGSLLLVVLVVFVAIIIRRQLLKKRMSKGPYKIILTTSDFVFPQVPQVDSRTVDEGIEAMLCCWLQQLQEFGGPEVEKPDLLQLGSVGSLKPYLRTSTGNLSRHAFLKDPRARYNGDLVQLKELPCQGAFELKNKAMDVLVTIHGLRHENLNPFIGCLNEPTRPCLVSEYCSRGSLEDVLVQDEIKLDWSFRLSLLTDVVRGMRYLHGTPIRVHGYLTSRNCVIDARWGVKITDYGLPAFYEAQNVVPPTKTARDLLWTAPELLRLPNLRKKGTQPGDVYSFGIIMQEVVVRGEPFCMLALSPEDIIEKVMKPPPLIRPSVSKGAAPPEAINIMRQCWAENADMRPNFESVYDLFKKLNHGRKVNFVDTMFQMLEKYSNNLEELIRERTEQLDMEKKKTEQLLNRMLPSSVAEKLKLGMPVDPEEFREVTIYFSDIVGFTTISAHSTPFQVVDLLNDLYTCFDATINAYTVYKVETIGDAYMVVGGCPVRIPDHASQIATMALDLLHQSGKFKLRHLPKMQLRLRIGLHTGPCCAGVVGLTMPRYCLFGDTVNTASRMESTGAPWRIHLSQATKDRLTRDGGYRIEYRGSTEVKGKGKMPTYWLLGKEGFDKELPTPPPLGENHGLDESIITENLPDENEVDSRGFEETLTKTKKRGGTEIGTSNAVIFDEVSLGSRDNNVIKDMIDDSKRNDAARSSYERDNVPVVSSNSEDRAWKENAETKKISVSVHEQRTLLPNHSFDSANELVEARSTKDGLTKNISVGGGDGGGGDSGEGHPPSASVLASKSTSGDTQISLGVASISGAEVAPVFLGASTSSLTSLSSSATFSHRVPSSRHRRITGCIDENDLSSPYNHYRCLSPNEHYGRNPVCRLLKRQFSLDRPDEPTCNIGLAPEQTNQRTTPRLYKQNSAGAANDLERIEEVPSTPGPFLQNYRQAASVSLSVESLSLH